MAESDSHALALALALALPPHPLSAFRFCFRFLPVWPISASPRILPRLPHRLYLLT